MPERVHISIAFGQARRFETQLWRQFRALFMTQSYRQLGEQQRGNYGNQHHILYTSCLVYILGNFCMTHILPFNFQ